MVAEHPNTVRKWTRFSLHNSRKSPNHKPKVFILLDTYWHDDRAEHKNPGGLGRVSEKKPQNFNRY